MKLKINWIYFRSIFIKKILFSMLDWIAIEEDTNGVGNPEDSTPEAENLEESHEGF